MAGAAAGGSFDSIFVAATEVPPVRFIARFKAMRPAPRTNSRAKPTTIELVAHVVRARGGALAAAAAAWAPARAW
jgi:hypothetical protein